MGRGRHRQQVLRNRVNFVSGWLLGFGLLALVVWADVLGVYSTWEDGGNGLTRENLGFVALFAAFSVGSFSLFARPHVRLQTANLLVCNVLRDVSIPRDAIDGVDTSGKYVRIAAGGRHYTAAGLEQSNMSHWTGGRFGLRAAEAMQEAVAPSAEHAPIVVRWRKPEVPEVVLVLIWSVYVVLGFAGTA